MFCDADDNERTALAMVVIMHDHDGDDDACAHGGDDCEYYEGCVC